MKSLSINAKLVLGNLSYSIPILVLIQQMVSVYQGNIQFAEWEKKGMVYQSALEDTFEYVGRHAWLAQRAHHGDIGAQNEMKMVETKVDDSIRKMEAAQADVGEDLQFTAEGLGKRQREHFQVPTFKREWQELKLSTLSLKPSDSIDKHNHLIADIRNMITHSGDTSNLILDPDLDSYYLMDVTLLALPQLHDRLLGIIIRSEQIIRGRMVTVEDMKWLTTTSAFLKQSDLDRIAADIQTALNEDKNFYGVSQSLQGRMGGEAESLKRQVEPLIALLDQLSSSSNVTMSARELLALAEGAYQTSFSFWRNGAIELNKFLDIRIADQVGQKNRSLTYGIMALIVATLLSTFFGISVRRSIINSIQSVTRRLSLSGDEVTKASQELSRVSMSMSSSSQEQASTMEETSASLYEIRQMITSNINAAESSGSLAQEVSALADETAKWMDELKMAMKSIFDSNERISELAKIIQEIGDKTEVIDEIVFKTQLLSFNASVEAERAGEHGRGFAVVAQEVGNLAQMSGGAATEIAAIVKNSIREAEAVSTENKMRVQKGESLAHETSLRMTGVIVKMNEILHSIKGIAKASREQGDGVNQITVTVENLNQITQQNAALAEECSSSSVELASQGEGLVNIINEMITLTNSGKKRDVPENIQASQAQTQAPKKYHTNPDNASFVSRHKLKSAPKHTDSEWEKIG